MFLAVPSRLAMHSVLTHVLWSCALGTATVVLVGLLGRMVAGDAVGIIAAVLAAIYPNIWAPDGMLQAETLGMFTVTLAVLLAYRYLRAPSWQRLAWVGGACGLGALARSELVLLVPILVVPLALLTRDQPWKQRWKWLGVAAAATAVLIAPWSIYNATRFAHPILLSAQIDPLLAAANCDSTYYGPLNGYFDIQCNAAVDARAGLTDRDDESQRGIADRRAALRYIHGHLDRLPYVEGVRALRILGLYHPQKQIVTDTFVEGRDEWVARDGLYTFWIVGVLAIAGAIVLRRRRTVPLYPLLAPVGVVVVTVLVTYASTRFRSTAEPVLVVLAALAVEGRVPALARVGALRQRRGTGRSCGRRWP